MKLEYRHRIGGNALSAPSGATYVFADDEQGRRVCDVEDAFDAAWFLEQTNLKDEPLFVQIETPRPRRQRMPAPLADTLETPPEGALGTEASAPAEPPPEEAA
jgi:hypothetical protein